jgi:ABC-type Fe3+/spermidine/putrescine transport system ATPase subunit
LLQNDTGISTIFVTHDQDEALSISDRICVMKDGEVQQIGTPREIYFKPANNFVARFVGAMNEIPGATAPEGNWSAQSTLLLRPDAVSVCARGEIGSLDAVVVGQHFGGSTTMVRLRLEQSEVVVSAQLLSRSVNLEAGDRVGVVLNTNEAIVEP